MELFYKQVNTYLETSFGNDRGVYLRYSGNENYKMIY